MLSLNIQSFELTESIQDKTMKSKLFPGDFNEYIFGKIATPWIINFVNRRHNDLNKTSCSAFTMKFSYLENLYLIESDYILIKTTNKLIKINLKNKELSCKTLKAFLLKFNET